MLTVTRFLSAVSGQTYLYSKSSRILRLVRNLLRQQTFFQAQLATFGNEISVNKRVHEGITSDEKAGANLLICI